MHPLVSRLMNGITPWKGWLLAFVLLIIAIWLNVTLQKPQFESGPSPMIVTQARPSTEVQERSQRPLSTAPSSVEPIVAVPTVVSEPPVDYAALYVSSLPDRTPDKRNVAVVAVTDAGAFHRSIANAISERLKAPSVSVSSANFKPQFIADGVFGKIFQGDTELIKQLNIAQRIDVLILARESIEYSIDPSLENVMSATASLEVAAVPLDGSGQQFWSFTSSGAGFKQVEARIQAEERLARQIIKSTNLILNW